jgi:thiol-disulfide isomerase/thioredoxin
VVDRRNQAVAAAALAYYETHPGDPRRWEAALAFASYVPKFYESFKPEFDRAPKPANAVIDKAAKAAWESRYAALLAAIRTAPDLPPAAREWLASRDLNDALRTAFAATGAARPVDWAALHGRLAAFFMRFPRSAKATRLLDYYMRAYESRHTIAESNAEWRSFTISPNSNVVEIAAEKARLLKNPLGLRFVAADGRQVDLAKLRGKVVLVDFWATWCGPCKEEIPDVLALYRQYHDRGFEVVGIALESADLKAGDSPDQTADKLAIAKKKLTDFTAEHGMPWPEYFDGRFWGNAISAAYGINAIPAMFLVERNGIIVSTTARGPELDEQVRDYLSL